MFIAGEAPGDNNAAEIIKRLPGRVPVFGAGGPKMQAAGMELLLDLTQPAGVGLIAGYRNVIVSSQTR